MQHAPHSLTGTGHALPPLAPHLPQLDNGIPIESWFEDKNDTELLKLSVFVHQLLGKEDVRPIVREKFKVRARPADARARIRARARRSR